MAAKTDIPVTQRIAMISIIAATLLAALVYGRDFLVPIVLAILFYGLLSSIIIRLEGLGMPSWLATAISIGSGIVVLAGMGFIVQNQFGALQEAWPQYVARFENLLAQTEALTGQEFVSRMQAAVSNLNIGDLVAKIAGSAGSVFNEIILIILYTLFLLAERGILTGKLTRLLPDQKERELLEAKISVVGNAVRQYLSIKAAVSTMTGLLTFAVAKFYGLHFAELVGLLAFVLNFIPVIGSAIAVVIPVVLAVMQFDTLAPALQLAVLLGVVQAVVGNVIEPRLMGKSLNLSPFVVIVALTFWTTIWGIPGAFLSVPITASAVIICRDIKPLRWFAVLLSVDGEPEVKQEERKTASTFSWPFGKQDEERAEIRKLRQELEEIKAERASRSG
ncbi:MAG: AI-2E family transporter [Rhizobiaceae bacterium]